MTGTQGAAQNGTSLPIDIPDVFVPAGQTVGVVLIYTQGGSRYFGTGSSAPVVFADANLTLTTGDSRSVPFTTGGSWFQSRGLHGEVTYVLGGVGGVGTNCCSPGVPNSIFQAWHRDSVGGVAVSNFTDAPSVSFQSRRAQASDPTTRVHALAWRVRADSLGGNGG